MTRSIFDPTGRETEHSGSQNLGPNASEISHMPPGFGDEKSDSDADDEVVDFGPSEPARPLGAEVVDAPQEAELMEEPDGLIEGQASDDSDAPQETAQ